MLDIVEHHVRLVLELSQDVRVDAPVALEFLLQTLAPLDVATRGFLDGTRALRGTTGPRRGPGRPRQIPHRPGEFPARGILRRRPRGRGGRDEQRLRRDPRLSARGFAVPLAAPVVGRQEDRRSNNNPGSAAAAAPNTRHRFGIEDGHLAWVTVSINAVRETGTRSRRLCRDDPRHHRRTGFCRPGKRGAAAGHRRGAWPRAWPRCCRSPSTSAGRRSTCGAWSRSCGRPATGEPTVQVAGEPHVSTLARTRSVVAHDSSSSRVTSCR